MSGANCFRGSKIRLFGVVFAGFFALILASSCGDDDPCATKTCEFGVCNSSTGQCTNRDSCQVDSDCIAGYLCQQDGQCVAQTTCSEDGDCETGICRDGACVNPSDCETNGECLPRTFCNENGNCAPDPCNNVTCQRGVCQRGTDNCVSADSCTQETEVQDCVPGEKCAAGTCEPMESFCDNVTCERGVCSFAEGGCVNASDCEGEDANCLEGRFCNEMNQCVPDLCQQNDVECGSEGVCVRATGECENAESCESSADCVAGHLCVDNACTTEGTACGNAGGDGGCPGNQTCNYNSDDLSAVCEEPDVCKTSIDCKDDRQCGGQTCLEPTSCQADNLEPNDMMSEATVFQDVAIDGTVSGTMCQGDTDSFTFTSSDIVAPTSEGTIVVEVRVPERDIGLGEMTMTMSDPDGNMIGSATMGSMAQEGSMRVTAPLGVPDHGQYSVQLETGQEMSMSGLSYDMSVEIVSDATVSACDDPQSVSTGQRLSGTLEDDDSKDLEATCASGTDNNAEKVYSLTLDRPQEVTINTAPQSGSDDVVVSLRSNCLSASSEIACSNANGDGAGESIEDVLSAGTYYIVVQAPGEKTLNNLDMTIDRNVFTACGPQDDYCDGSDNAFICTPDGGALNELACDAGCNASKGTCVPPAGNRCSDAPTIQPPDSMGGSGNQTVTKEIDLRQFQDEYQISSGGCLGGTPRTGGKDATFEVTVPDEKFLKLDANFDNGVEGSLYLADSCESLESSCVKGAQGSVDGSPSQETLSYTNLSGSEQTLYLVVDAGANQFFGSVTIDATYQDVICQPGGTSCTSSGDIGFCSEDGASFEDTVSCSNCCSTLGSASSSPGKVFPPTVTDTVNVSGCNGTISQVLVPMDISHTWKGDIDLELQSPGGTTVKLHDNTGGSSDDIKGIYGDDLSPEGSLSDFNGASANGTWTLTAVDTVTFLDDGTLNDWSVIAACN